MPDKISFAICQPKSLGWLPHGVSGFFEMNDHGDEAKAENCSNYAANDGEEYRNTMNFKHDEVILFGIQFPQTAGLNVVIEGFGFMLKKE